MIKTIVLSKYDMQRCVDFSKESAKSQQAIEFGQSDTVPRRIAEIARDNLIGKMAEVAITHMLREDFGLHFTVNFDIYPRGEWDDFDVQINGWNVDIKSTRIGQWLLFEVDKLRMRQNQKYNNLPDAIFMCRTPWNRELDEPKGTVELIGAVSLKNLLSNNSKVVRLKKGDFIPNTRAKLQAENYGIHFSNISSDWGSIIPYMLTNPPPDASAYIIP
ncbi:hypothetical protein SAMN02910344_01211 [Ruminobacter amylophilus]|uniref:Uncharacterized protein n=1 Tax=Ruminobacter amylophilus TaxID=867 RepID=A0A662ZIQ1_9GAMM|nr:hypothetical protein [Ruminobacter amylophilus]SFP37079.1 hypothetical protein SAMN02910344_01211 [Ruminobacter amylophilus]